MALAKHYLRRTLISEAAGGVDELSATAAAEQLQAGDSGAMDKCIFWYQ